MHLNLAPTSTLLSTVATLTSTASGKPNACCNDEWSDVGWVHVQDHDV